MATSFELLADPTRRRVLDELRTGERSVGELVERLQMSQPAVSKQLRVLREAGLASVRADAQRRIYRLEPRGLREVDEADGFVKAHRAYANTVVGWRASTYGEVVRPSSVVAGARPVPPSEAGDTRTGRGFPSSCQ